MKNENIKKWAQQSARGSSSMNKKPNHTKINSATTILWSCIKLEKFTTNLQEFATRKKKRDKMIIRTRKIAAIDALLAAIAAAVSSHRRCC
jgi:hypothetical protein